jgi:hypothetical protein
MCHLRVFLFNSLWIAGGMSSVFLFDFFALGRLLVMHGQTILLLRKIAPIHWVFVLSFVCVLLLDAVSAPTKSCECGLNATWVYVHNVFCFLSSLPLIPSATTAVFGSDLLSLYP